MQKVFSSILAASMLLTAAPASAAMISAERVSRRGLLRHASTNQRNWTSVCANTTGADRATCLNETLKNAGKKSRTQLRTQTGGLMPPARVMVPANKAMLRSTAAPTRTSTMERSALRNGVRVDRSSPRAMRSTIATARLRLIEKCKALRGAEKVACLNPKSFRNQKKNDGNMSSATWYMLDEDAQLWWSTDGKEWSESEAGTWKDKDGHWLKIGEGKLWWSADEGVTWTEVPQWTWMGTNGVWYKFDADWKLWKSTDDGSTWTDASSWM